MFVTYNFATLLKTATGRVLSSVPVYFKLGRCFARFCFWKSTLPRYRYASASPSSPPLLFSLRPTRGNTPEFFPRVPPTGSRQHGSRALFVPISLSLPSPSVRVYASLPNASKPWIFPFPFNSPFSNSFHRSSSVTFLILYYVGLKMSLFSRRE